MYPPWERESDFPGVGVLARRHVWGQGAGGQPAVRIWMFVLYLGPDPNPYPPGFLKSVERSGVWRRDSWLTGKPLPFG